MSICFPLIGLVIFLFIRWTKCDETLHMYFLWQSATFLARLFSEKTWDIAIVLVLSLASSASYKNFDVSLLLLKTFTCNSEYMYNIKRPIHTIKGDSSKCVFSELYPFSCLDILSCMKHPTAHVVLLFHSFSFYRLQMLSIWTSLKICRFVKSYLKCVETPQPKRL